MGYIVRFVILAAASSLVIGLVRYDDFRACFRESARVFAGMLCGVAALGLVVSLFSRF